MKPVVAIVGRPNVGKSTLFNRIVGQKRAIVLDTPGVTRDRNYGDASWSGVDFSLVDTGGLEPEGVEGVVSSVRAQAMMAIGEADVVVAVVDGQDGLTPPDEEVVRLLRQSGRNVVYVVNKVDGPGHEGLAAEFYALGVDPLVPISAEHGRGIGRLLEAVIERLPRAADDDASDDETVTRVALVGRPNVGKSTLVNRLLGAERMITDQVPGTTRDAIDHTLIEGDRTYTLIDTAGLRRKRGIDRRSSEGHSVMRTLRAIERCHVAIQLIDGSDDVAGQDARIAGIACDKGRALILAVNKWDAVEKDARTAQRVQETLRFNMPFASFAPVLFMSGLSGQRVHRLLGLVDHVRAAHLKRVPTGPLNRWLETCVARHQPPVVGGRRLKFYYVTQAGVAPPSLVISCNLPDGVHFSYRRFLVNQFRETFDVEGTPVRLIFRARSGRNER